MSRIGNAPINVPANVTINVTEGNVNLKGPKGELDQSFDNDAVSLELNEGVLTVQRKTELKDHKAKHGLYRALMANAIEGVVNGFSVKQELVGVGYRATVQGQVLEMSLGFSHNVMFKMPDEVKVEADTQKGQNPIITLTSCNKQLIGQVAAKIRSLRKPEPYKGKGIKFVGEEIRRKAGKAAGK
ncbi:50S ribosomal protein L6 [Flavobacteriales bacterium]|jgi:large subunit ribosomal protein L6|nr:50S ribosomal protein L6 [Flavobacteriales bacterium]